MSSTPKPTKSSKTRIACVGGFLGSGKTSAIIEAAQRLMGRGLRVGIITNDQGHDLVDTALVRSRGIAAAEIGGGCFCCQFSEFAVQAQRLADQQRVDVILAEAVGSCTDLAASVYNRLRRYHSQQFVVAPLTVMVDPQRILAMLEDGAGFDENVRYLFRKQLAEADEIVLTKSDLLYREELERLRNELQQLLADRAVNVMSAKTGVGVDEWIERLLTTEAGERQMELDYEIYGRAEASLGWLNATIDLHAQKEFRPSVLGKSLMSEIQAACRSAEWDIAHVKIMFVTGEGSDWIALTDSQGAAVWGGGIDLLPCHEASVIVNARVATRPDRLRATVEASLRRVSDSHGIAATVCHMESFAPLPPRPPTDHYPSNSLVENGNVQE